MILGLPEYIRLQCQKVILNQHLKVPHVIAWVLHNQDKDTAMQLFKLLNRSHLELKQEDKACLKAAAHATAVDKEKDIKVCSCPLTLVCVVS